MDTIAISPPKVNTRHWFAFALCMISYLFGGTVSTIMSVYLPVAIPELLKDHASEARLGEIGAYISAIFIYGWMSGGLLFGIIGDKIGRKRTLTLGTGLYGIATLLIVFVKDWQILMLYRFLSGMGVGGVLLVSTVYISEIWEEKSRAIVLGVLAVSFPLGIVASGGLNVLFPVWRQAFWLGLIPTGIALLILFFLPESTKWLQSKNENTDEKSPSIFDAQNLSNLLSGSLIFGAVLIGLWGIFSWLPTWVQSLLEAGQDGRKERGFTMMLLGIGGILGGILSGFLINKWGSRKTLMGTFIGCFIACGLLFITNQHFSKIIYLETAFLSLFFGISQGSLSSYIPALFPIAIRATASGFCFNVGRFFTATAVFFVGTLVSFFGGFGNALLTFSITFVIAFIAAYFSKNTK